MNRRKSRKDSAAKERRHLHAEEVRREIDQIVAEYHALFPREQATQLGGIYARYSTDFQDSVGDQVRALMEFAVSMQIFVPRERIFFDLATTGRSEKRPGLLQLRSALEKRNFQVLLVFATNRLYRKAYRSLQLVEEEIVERGLRCIFAKQGIDTANEKQWRMTLQIFSAMDEAYSGMYADNIRAAHMGLASRALVYSTIAFGYRGNPIEGQITKRHRPRCEFAIDETAAEYVRRIFQWFVNDVLSIDDIVRRLKDDPAAPKPPKAEAGWTRKAVVGVLNNTRYRAEFPCSATETKWLSKADYARQFPREKPLGTFIHEHLRIVSDEIWFQAQIRLRDSKMRRGRKPGDSTTKKPSFRLLNGILVCPVHDRQLYIGGPKAGSFYCKDCRETVLLNRPLFTLLDQDLATHKICSTIRQLLTSDEELVKEIIVRCQAAADEIQTPDPAIEADLRARDLKLKRSIEFALRDPGQSPSEEADTMQLVRQLRKERSAVQAELTVLEHVRKRPIRVPTEDEVKACLSQLDKILVAAESDSEEDKELARGIIELVTGGRIELVQMGERERGKGFLRGTFHCNIGGTVASRLINQDVNTEPMQAVAIDFQKTSGLDEEAERAKELDDRGILRVEIAHQLGCSKSKVTKLLRHWYVLNQLPFPDGRTRRSQLTRKHQEPQLYQRIADRVMELCREDRLLQDIANELDVDRNIVTAAIRYWHELKELPVPDGRTRRRSLPRRGKSRRRRTNPS